MLERFYKLKIVVDEITCNPQLIQGISKKQERNLKNLILKAKNWEIIIILIKLLKPFYKASLMLQGKTYQTLSLSKAIEIILFQYYENIVTKSSGVELIIAIQLKSYLDTYLNFKISAEQKHKSLVNILF
jgi:hypothetical protein